MGKQVAAVSCKTRDTVTVTRNGESSFSAVKLFEEFDGKRVRLVFVSRNGLTHLRAGAEMQAETMDELAGQWVEYRQACRSKMAELLAGIPEEDRAEIVEEVRTLRHSADL
jgi:hypothetical protein